MKKQYYAALFFAACSLLSGCTGLAGPSTVKPATPVDATADVLAAQADAASARGDLVGAVALYEQVAALAPERAVSWFRLGSAHLRNSQPKAAQTALEKAISLEPTSGRAQANLALAHLAQFRQAASVAIQSDQVSQANRAALASLLRDVDQMMFAPAPLEKPTP